MARKTGSSWLLALALLATFSAAGFAVEAIQEQYSTDGNLEASLIGANVRDNVLTIKVMLKNVSGENADVMFLFKNVYYTDMKEKSKYYCLKDSENQYIAGPKYDNSNGGRFWYKIPPEKKKILWAKFPAPPANTESIDVFIPDLLPFESVKVGR